jgi:hypothetical protein
MTDVPATPPAQDPPAQDPPATEPPASAARPEGIPETLWTDSGFNAEAFGKYRAPAEDVPAAADAYTLPTIEGVDLDENDPLIPILRTHAFEAGIGQAGFEKVVSDYATELKKLDDASYDAAIKAIGDNAEGRIKNVSTWLDGKLPTTQAGALKNLLTSADALLGLEQLMNAGVVTPPRDTVPAAPARKSEAEIRSLMASPGYSGKPHQRDPKVIEEVTKWFADQEAERQKAAAAAPK